MPLLHEIEISTIHDHFIKGYFNSKIKEGHCLQLLFRHIYYSPLYFLVVMQQCKLPPGQNGSQICIWEALLFVR